MVTPTVEETETPMVERMAPGMEAQQAAPMVATAEAMAEATVATKAAATAKEPRAPCSNAMSNTLACRNHTHQCPAESPTDSKRRQRRRNRTLPRHHTYPSTAHPRSGSPVATEAMMATVA